MKKKQVTYPSKTTLNLAMKEKSQFAPGKLIPLLLVLAVLAGLDADVAPVMPYSGGPLGGRMIVFCELENRLDTLLPALRKLTEGYAALGAAAKKTLAGLIPELAALIETAEDALR